jgi:ribosomal protein L37AE/L43A
MYSRDEQLSIITDISIGEGQSITTDCPFCSGRNKFTISKRDGTTLWNCYRASCNAKGAFKSGFKTHELKDKLNGVKTELTRRSRPLPKVTSNPSHHPAVLEYLERNNCLFAFQNRLANIRYNPADDRVLFYTNSGQGAIGRHLGSAVPKWLCYGDTSGILKVGDSPNGVIVEDAASACAVAATNLQLRLRLTRTQVRWHLII